MAEGVYAKLDIAYEYLEVAMQLYIEETNYFSSINLAAAAEELFEKHLPKTERISTITLKAQIALQILYTDKQIEYDVSQDPRGDEYKKAKKIVLGSKNEIKHMNDDISDSTVTIDPASTARRWIEDALINFEKARKLHGYKPQFRKSPTRWKFDDYTRRERHRLMGRAE